MTQTVNSPVETILNNWCEYVQSPAQLGFLRLSKFPPGSGGKLTNVLEIEKGDRVLEVGSGLGILANRVASTGLPSETWGCELNENYLHAELPDVLQPEGDPNFTQGDAFSLPFPTNSFDNLYTHTLATLLRGDAWDKFHAEIRRVVKSGGTVTHMDSNGGDSWSPEGIGVLADEQERRNQFFDLLMDVHRELESGYAHTARDLPKFFHESDFKNVNVQHFASTMRLDNPEWTQPQAKRMLELWQRADRNRIQRFSKLLEMLGRLTDEREQLLEKCLSDVQQQAFRRRKALEEDRELGWRSSTTIAVTAEI